MCASIASFHLFSHHHLNSSDFIPCVRIMRVFSRFASLLTRRSKPVTEGRNSRYSSFYSYKRGKDDAVIPVGGTGIPVKKRTERRERVYRSQFQKSMKSGLKNWTRAGKNRSTIQPANQLRSWMRGVWEKRELFTFYFTITTFRQRVSASVLYVRVFFRACVYCCPGDVLGQTEKKRGNSKSETRSRVNERRLKEFS